MTRQRFTTRYSRIVHGHDEPPWSEADGDVPHAMDHVDFTGGKTLLELAEELAKRKVVFCVADARHLMPELERFGVVDAVGADHVFETLDDAVAAFHALPPSPDSP